MSSVNIFDFLIIICGIYMVYNGIIMKTQGKINPGTVLSRNTDPNAIKDKEGFIKYMWWKLLGIGILCTVAGCINIAIEKTMGDSQSAMVIQLVMNLVFFVILMIYAAIAIKAQRKFIGQ